MGTWIRNGGIEQGISEIQEKCQLEAIHMGDELFPCDCLDILKKNYGNRLNNMNAKTIYNKIMNMMGTLQDYSDNDFVKGEVVELVNNFWWGSL